MSAAQQFRIGPLRFDEASGELIARTRSRRLEPRASAVLAALCAQRGQMVTRQDLLDQCWGNGEGSDEALTQAISQIRRAMHELGASGDLIETLAKRGYRVNGDSEPAATQPEVAGPATGQRGSMIAFVALFAIVAALLVAPHDIRHSVRHALGLGPSAH